jgi:hypothetical protein
MISAGTITIGDVNDKDNTDAETLLLVVTCFVGLIAMAFFFCVCCGYKSLKMAIDVIDASADFLAGTKRILLVPGLFFFLQLITVTIWVGAMMCVLSMNEITANEAIPQGKNLLWVEKT